MQRRRGEEILVFRSGVRTDNRGNETIGPIPANPHKVRVSVQPLRGSRAEVPGQQEINIYTIQAPPDLQGVDLWSQIERSDGSRWDVVAPPVLRTGTRHTRHWTMDIRHRPDNMKAEE